MEECRQGIFKTIGRNSPIEADSPFVVLKQAYQDLARDVRASPRKIVYHQKVINAVLAPFSEDKGELMFDEGGNRIYFSLHGKDFTNFGVIP